MEGIRRKRFHHHWSTFEPIRISFTFAMEKLLCTSRSHAVYWTPCTVLDSTGKNHCHMGPVCSHLVAGRICIALKLRGQQVMSQTLHRLFEVAHVDNKLPERGLCYMKGSF